MWAQANPADLGRLLGCSHREEELEEERQPTSLVVPYFGYSVYKCFKLCVDMVLMDVMFTNLFSAISEERELLSGGGSEIASQLRHTAIL